jgi:hypothetical protein
MAVAKDLAVWQKFGPLAYRCLARRAIEAAKGCGFRRN